MFDLQKEFDGVHSSTWRSNRRRGRSVTRSTENVCWHLLALHDDLIVTAGVSWSGTTKREALHSVALHGDQIVVTDVLWFGSYKKS